MKKVLLIMLAAISLQASAQKIVKYECDKFTKCRSIETSYVTMYKKVILMSTEHGINMALRKYGDDYILLTDIKNISPVRYVEGNGIILLLDDDSTIKLTGNYTDISTKSEIGSAVNAYNFSTSFNLTNDEVEALKSHKILSIRTTYAAGSFDGDVKKNNQQNVQKMFEVISDKENNQVK